MVHTYTLAYLRMRSLPELFTLRAKLQQKRGALPCGSADLIEITQALERIHWLLTSRSPGFRPR